MINEESTEINELVQLAIDSCIDVLINHYNLPAGNYILGFILNDSPIGIKMSEAKLMKEDKDIKLGYN